MSLKEKIDEAKEKAEGVLEEGERFLKKTKKAVYTGIATLEQKVEKRKGVGKLIAEAGDIGKEVGTAVGTKAKNMHEHIMEEGGYRAAAKRTGEAIKNTAVDVYDSLSGTYNKFRETITTEGKYDPNKAREVLKDKAKATAEFGEKAVKSLVYMVKQGAGMISDDFRKDFPSREERATKYAGIGTDYKGVLMREHLDACLQFYEKARKKLPARLKGRQEILADIKASASSSAKELKGFYKQDQTAESQDLLKIVRKYFR